MTNTSPAIETESLTKQFGTVTAVEGLDMVVPAGSVYGFLGPNGAGKSTTIDILVDLVHPTSGSGRVLGYDTQSSPVEIRRRTGVLLDRFTPFATLTAREHVAFAASTKEVEIDPEAVLERVGLLDAIDQKAGDYSRGMSQRLGLAMALIGEPDLLILDEPTAGLDPNGVPMLRQVVREENARGATVFFSSHVLSQVEVVCDRIAIIDNGRLVVEDDVQKLRDAVDGEIVLRARVRIDGDPSAVRDQIDGIDGVRDVSLENGDLVVVCESESVSARVLSTVDRLGATVDSFETDGRSLERVFNAYTDEV
ncbi:ABC transporter ATP-binding protein [Halovivax gelatinilyticus]|uniref:ABC transporter ATP-binding protein n=1 Tax=Halovivax gelatinilyticus TaxID=2961597 RepID=UPI0020CA7EF3|nr:ABC transporter ATP-binding protein [Halovivax gelatinilyticus]